MATITAKALEQMMQSHVRAETGMSLEQATPRDYWTALSKSIVEIISENWIATRHKYNQGRQAHSIFSSQYMAVYPRRLLEYSQRSWDLELGQLYKARR